MLKTIMFKKLFFIVIIVVLVLIGYYFISVNSRGNYVKQDFYIEKGDGVKLISSKLKERGIIKSEEVFIIYSLVSGNAKKFVPGNHVIQNNLNISEISAVLADSKSIVQERTITILEGWSVNEIANYLDTQEIVKKEEFVSASEISLWNEKYVFLQDNKIINLEGFLFPDTYRIFVGTTADKIIEKMLDNFKSKVTSQMVKDIGANNRSLQEIITMASIIEKEAKYFSDKKMVSDVFWKRLTIGMPLQSDATINYFTGKGLTRSRYVDLEIDSPYNTYKYKGLPPGPICNPGIESITSAIYPQSNEYLYFITDSSGKAVFGKTFEEHKSNIAKYLD